MNPKPTALTPVVSFEDVSKVYGKVRAVDRLSLELWPGHTVAFLGPSGRASRRRWTCCLRCASRPAAESAARTLGGTRQRHARH
jgi:ABC-type phosphonate transport system ATPase subunit